MLTITTTFQLLHRNHCKYSKGFTTKNIGIKISGETVSAIPFADVAKSEGYVQRTVDEANKMLRDHRK